MKILSSHEKGQVLTVEEIFHDNKNLKNDMIITSKRREEKEGKGRRGGGGRQETKMKKSLPEPWAMYTAIFYSFFFHLYNYC